MPKRSVLNEDIQYYIQDEYEDAPGGSSSATKPHLYDLKFMMGDSMTEPVGQQQYVEEMLANGQAATMGAQMEFMQHELKQKEKHIQKLEYLVKTLQIEKDCLSGML